MNFEVDDTRWHLGLYTYLSLCYGTILPKELTTSNHSPNLLYTRQ